MRKFIAIIALFVAVGFAGGAEAHSVVRSTAQRVDATDISGSQFISAAPQPAAVQADHEDRDCCWNGLCFNLSHCHHCGTTTAVMFATPPSTLFSASHAKFGLFLDTMLVLSLSYVIIDPPRA